MINKAFTLSLLLFFATTIASFALAGGRRGSTAPGAPAASNYRHHQQQHIPKKGEVLNQVLKDLSKNEKEVKEVKRANQKPKRRSDSGGAEKKEKTAFAFFRDHQTDEFAFLSVTPF